MSLKVEIQSLKKEIKALENTIKEALESNTDLLIHIDVGESLYYKITEGRQEEITQAEFEALAQKAMKMKSFKIIVNLV